MAIDLLVGLRPARGAFGSKFNSFLHCQYSRVTYIEAKKDGLT
jgi:hypothetical protein